MDTGMGISQEDRAIIFDSFQQGNMGRTAEGTGLGLSIAKANAELLGGQLDFESEPGRGSRFFFTVHLQSAMDGLSASRADTKGRVIHLATECNVDALVVDDNPENREILARMLSDIGVEVVSAESGIKALECVRLQQPDIIFMDIRMKPMDGIEAAKQIWAEFGHESMKIVAVSASAFTHEQAEYLSTGFDFFVPRPFLAEQIYDCLASVLHVEYEYEDLESSPVSLLDPSKITLPADLLKRMEEEAELYSVTKLESYLDEIKEISESGQQLAEHLYPLLQQNDMDAILNILSQVKGV
jgi:CheY-like chemotaxis protein